MIIKLVKSLENGKKKTKQKVNYPKHRKIDRSTGADYQITYGGVTVKVTEFKIKTNKVGFKMIKNIFLLIKKKINYFN